jgi:hypothetical protein
VGLYTAEVLVVKLQRSGGCVQRFGEYTVVRGLVVRLQKFDG